LYIVRNPGLRAISRQRSRNRLADQGRLVLSLMMIGPDAGKLLRCSGAMRPSSLRTRGNLGRSYSSVLPVSNP
jgi:hypothetical protein